MIILLISFGGSFQIKASAVSQKITVDTEVLNIRSGPSLSYPIVQKGRRGESYNLLQTEGDWFEIQLSNGKKGWIASWLVKTVNKETSQSSGTVTVDRLNLRSDPSLSSAIIKKINSGEQVKIIESSSDWLKVLSGEEEGWVSRKYVQLNTEKVDSNHSEMITILHNGTNLRSQPTIHSNIVARSNSGDTYNVLGKENDWYKVQLTNGDTAYVASWIVSTTVQVKTKKSNEKSKSGLKGKNIVIDPGHGGVDSGTIGFIGTLEKNVTLRTAKLLYEKLTNAGANVFLTRVDDRFVPLPTRVGMSEINQADAFISLHYDSINDQSVTGHTTYYYHSLQKLLALDINEGITDQIQIENRGVRFGDFHVIRENTQPAVLLELGYLSNPAQEAAINSNQYQELISTGIYKGLEEYFK